MAVRATVLRFPMDTDAREGSGLLWGVTVTPFAAVNEDGQSPAYGSGGDLLPRCENCWAYFNTYCELEQWSWSCSLCGNLNGLSSEAIERYSRPQSCAEMMSSFVDLELPSQESSEVAEMQACPVYVAAVDLSSSEEFIELTKSALLAALEALAPGSLFGLATFSHKLGLYDVQGPIPVVKNVFIPPDAEGTLPIELEDAMPLLQFLAPVETCKDRIASALETLRPTTSWERTTSGQGLDGVLIGGRGFGMAMEALCNYLGSEYGSTFALARIFAFLSGPPDFGAGQLDTRRYGEQYASKREDADRALLPEQTPFYKDLAAVAVQAGVCVDIFAVTNEYTDLASLKFLSIESGASLFLYTSTEDSTLPQDMYRMLSRPYAFGCVLRLRTSTEFKPGNSYGHFFPDPQYENVQHIICCDSYATYAYDFVFENNTGFSRNKSDVPTIQIAFQYAVVVPPQDDSGGVSTSRTKHSLQRRLRIRTLQFGVAQNIHELYDSCDPEVVLSLLVHKVILASLEEGVREGRILLQEWLVILTAQYNDAYKLIQYSDGSSIRSQIDVAFSQCPQLQPLRRLIFALLRNPLLRFHEEGVHPDFRIYLQCLFSGLEPSSLHRAVYPVLTSYATPDKQAYPRHSLSRAALITSGSPIFFLDAFTILIVFYSSTADPTLPFPPPHDCLLRTTINKLKQERCITPKLIFIRGGQDDASIFENYLIEEQDVDGSGLTSVMGFVSFLEDITQKVLEFMK
ncbi:protein transport protein SEC24 isoform X1 [Abrus precatorius]|uniref:Protein transport protein SEC24 isoform X1 n=1 Tax=Abrus precatorius TaxID=3816 RepID=A0A8B8KRD8_ABRPR|nr:protein transport protein SEC24 isoform X1 [Abrus precatorius]